MKKKIRWVDVLSQNLIQSGFSLRKPFISITACNLCVNCFIDFLSLKFDAQLFQTDLILAIISSSSLKGSFCPSHFSFNFIPKIIVKRVRVNWVLGPLVFRDEATRDGSLKKVTRLLVWELGKRGRFKDRSSHSVDKMQLLGKMGKVGFVDIFRSS